MLIIITIFWALMFSTLCFEYMVPLLQIPENDRIIAMLVFLMGAPFFFISNILNNILDCLFPEGWDDN